METHTNQAVLNPRWDRRETSARKKKVRVRCILSILIATIAFTAIYPSQTPRATSAATAAALTNCGAPTVITLSQLETLTTNTIIPDKTSLTPPCSVTYNGQTYPTYVELDGMTLDTNPYTGDCNANVQGYCDVHLEFACTVSAGCLFEIDQKWFAAGYTYPVNTQGAGSIAQGSIVSATGFLYIDDHGIHELHPTVSVSVGGAPPANCSNGAIDPPACTTCPTGYVMQNSTCVTQPPPTLSTSFTFNPTSPTINSAVTFTSTAVGGTGPYTTSWDFGDGASGTGATAVHIYTSVQTFTVTESVTDSSVPSQTVTKSLNIAISPASTAGLTASMSFTPSSPLVGQTVSFTSTASGGLAPYSYSWDLGDGGTGTGSAPTHTYTAAGVYTVAFMVSDSSNLRSSEQTILIVTQPTLQVNNPPILSTPADQTVKAGNIITFTVNATDPDPGERIIFTASGLPQGATFDSFIRIFSWTPSPSQTGTYTVIFIATDNGSPPRSDSKPVAIQVEPTATNGGTGGSTGGSTKAPSGGCSLCGFIHQATTNTWILVMGGILGFNGLLAVKTLRSHSELARVKRRLRFAS